MGEDVGLERGLVRERGRAEVAGEAGEGGGGLEVVLAWVVVVEGGKGMLLLLLLMGVGGGLHGREGLLLLLLWLLLLDKLSLLLCLLLCGCGGVCLRRPRVLPLGVLVEVAAGGEVLGAHGAREGAAVGAVAAGHLGRGEREEGNGEKGAKQIDWYYSTVAPLFEGPPSEKRKPSDSLVGNCKVAGEKRYELEGGRRKKRTPCPSTQLSSPTLGATFSLYPPFYGMEEEEILFWRTPPCLSKQRERGLCADGGRRGRNHLRVHKCVHLSRVEEESEWRIG